MAHICLDNDEKKYVKLLLDKRQKADMIRLEQLYLKNICLLLDSTIRKHYYMMCYKCFGSEGTHYHICEDQTAVVFSVFGSRVLDYATSDEIKQAWKGFIADIQKHDIFKRVVYNWLREYSGPKDEINKDWDKYTDFLKLHFPEPTQNPHQVFNYDDID